MKGMGWVWLLVIILVVAGLWMSGLVGGKSLSANDADYQAVFLGNGQVYFGKLSGSGDVLALKDIYYLQVQQQIQPAEGEEAAKPDVKLIKLGNEVHGPKDEMRIRADKVIFVEDLKEDGKVVSAIRRYKEGGETAPASTSTESESTKPAGE